MRRLPVDAYVLETLMPDLVGHDRHPAAFLVYLALWARTRAVRRETIAVSLRDLAEASGLSKRAVQTAVDALVRRRLVALERETPTSVPSYAVLRPWARRG